MAGVETYGGCCPKCLHGMMQKWESSWSGFMFDACPWCGFIYIGEGNETSEKEAQEAWKVILEHAGVTSREELIQKYNLEPFTPEDNKEFYPSLWDYSHDEGTLEMYRLLFKQYGNHSFIKRKEAFSVEGQRVYWHENREQEGTLMEFAEGKVFILWDEHKGSKLPYFEYPATEVGKTVLLVNPIDAPPVISEDDWVNEEVFEALNYLQRKGMDVRDLREKFMQADTELFVSIESREVERMEKAKENLAEIVDEIRQLCKAQG